MRVRVILLLALPALLAGLLRGGTTGAAPAAAGGAPLFTPAPRPARPPPTGKSRTAFAPVSLFGMNLYLTGLERSDAEARLLGGLAAQAGVRWSREELSWANLEPQAKGHFNWGPYDTRLADDATNGISVVGMLLTTPHWAATPCSATAWFWCEPRHYADYFDFVRAAVTRWRGQIHVWEIWNEPNATGTWACVNNACDHAADYAALLAGAYAAVKAVDPSARVLIGGLYVHDYNDEGMAFLNQVVADSGGAINFDGLSIHTFMPDRVPEATLPDSVVQNFQYRLNMANDWINAHGGRPAEIWITEDGRSTCTSCAYAWSEDDQASMLARMYGIAGAMPRVAQFDWFQFEDKFNNPADLYGGMAIVRDDYSLKPAYHAYTTAARLLDGATFSGPGPQMVPGGAPHQPASSNFAGFDYRYVRNDTAVHMLWRVTSAVTVNYPVETAQVDVVDRDGTTTRLVATNGAVPLTIGPRPQYVVSVACGHFADVCPAYWAYPYVEFVAAHGIVSGYADGTFRPAATATRGQLAKMIVVARGWPVVTPAVPTFTDVPPAHPFYGYVETAHAHNAIAGYTCGPACLQFRPDTAVTRGQIAKIVVSAFGWPADTSGGPHFADVSPANPFYVFVETAYHRAVISGYAVGTFRPGADVTRAQLSKMLYEALNQ